MWHISDDQVCRIQNRMSDIRALFTKEQIMAESLVLAVGELLGALDAVLWDERNYGDEKDRE